MPIYLFRRDTSGLQISFAGHTAFSMPPYSRGFHQRLTSFQPYMIRIHRYQFQIHFYCLIIQLYILGKKAVISRVFGAKSWRLECLNKGKELCSFSAGLNSCENTGLIVRKFIRNKVNISESMGKIFYAEFQRLDKRALFQIVLETKWLVYETDAKYMQYG